MFDVFIFSLPSGFIMAPALSGPLSIPGGEQVLAIAILFAWVFVEAFLLSTWGTTPGKWLLKTRVALRSGRAITYSEAMRRGVAVWWRGLGTGFPVASLITMVVAHNRLTRDGITSWDREGDFVVTHERLEGARVAMVVLVLCASLVLIVMRKAA